MDDRSLLDTLRGIAADVVGPTRVPATVDADTLLREGGLWLDSLELLRVILSCEAKFGLTFAPDEDLMADGLRSFGTLAASIRRRSPQLSSAGTTSRVAL